MLSLFYNVLNFYWKTFYCSGRYTSGQVLPNEFSLGGIVFLSACYFFKLIFFRNKTFLQLCYQWGIPLKHLTVTLPLHWLLMFWDQLFFIKLTLILFLLCRFKHVSLFISRLTTARFCCWAASETILPLHLPSSPSEDRLQLPTCGIGTKHRSDRKRPVRPGGMAPNRDRKSTGPPLRPRSYLSLIQTWSPSTIKARVSHLKQGMTTQRYLVQNPTQISKTLI